MPKLMFISSSLGESAELGQLRGVGQHRPKVVSKEKHANQEPIHDCMPPKDKSSWPPEVPFWSRGRTASSLRRRSSRSSSAAQPMIAPEGAAELGQWTERRLDVSRVS